MKTPALAAAFRATSYRVKTAAGVFDLRIGDLNPDFDGFLRGQGVCCWGLITACNPGAERSDENAERQRLLMSRLQGLAWLPACNVADDSAWPTEPSVLILQVGPPELSALACELGQLAVVCGEVGDAPRLVWMQDERCCG